MACRTAIARGYSVALTPRIYFKKYHAIGYVFFRIKHTKDARIMVYRELCRTLKSVDIFQYNCCISLFSDIFISLAIVKEKQMPNQRKKGDSVL
jgi:hypothetical protein